VWTCEVQGVSVGEGEDGGCEVGLAGDGCGLLGRTKKCSSESDDS